MIMVICFAAFQATRQLGDLVALLIIGLLGIVMKRFGWSRPAFLIGFVLAGQMETYLYQAVQFYDWGFLLRPGVLIIGALTLISIVLGALYGRPGSESDKGEASLTQPANRSPQIIFASVLLIAFAYGLYDAFQQSFLGGVFTGGVAAVMLVFSAWVLIKLISGTASDPVNCDQEAEYAAQGAMAGQWHYLIWLGGFLVLLYLTGFIIAISVFFIAFLLTEARVSLLRALLLTVCGVGFLIFLAHMMYLDFPRGLLQDAVDLPWPIN